MVFRKVTDRLKLFASDRGKSALLIDGARQVGKTFIVEEFGWQHYEPLAFETPGMGVAHARKIC